MCCSAVVLEVGLLKVSAHSGPSYYSARTKTTLEITTRPVETTTAGISRCYVIS